MVKLNGMLYSGAGLLVLLGTVWGLVDGSLPEPAENEEPAQPQARVLGEHRYAVRCLAFSPDGKTLATGDGYAMAPGEIKLWDVPTGGKLATLLGNQDGFYSVAFAPDGRTLASVSLDEVLTLWDVTSGRELARAPVSVPSSLHTVLAPDGRTLAMVGWKGDAGSVQLWQVAQEPGDSLTGGSGPFAFSADGEHLALWRLAAEPQSTIARSAARPRFTPVAPCRDLPAGQWWDIPLGRPKHRLCGDENYTWTVAFSPDGQTLASGGFDETVKLWDLATGREQAVFRGHTDQIEAVAFAPDGKALASGSYDKTVKLWDLSSRRELATLCGHSGRVACVAFSPDGRWLASGSHDQTVRLWQLPNTKAL